MSFKVFVEFQSFSTSQDYVRIREACQNSCPVRHLEATIALSLYKPGDNKEVIYYENADDENTELKRGEDEEVTMMKKNVFQSGLSTN